MSLYACTVCAPPAVLPMACGCTVCMYCMSSSCCTFHGMRMYCMHVLYVLLLLYFPWHADVLYACTVCPPAVLPMACGCTVCMYYMCSSCCTSYGMRMYCMHVLYVLLLLYFPWRADVLYACTVCAPPAVLPMACGWLMTGVRDTCWTVVHHTTHDGWMRMIDDRSP